MALAEPSSSSAIPHPQVRALQPIVGQRLLVTQHDCLKGIVHCVALKTGMQTVAFKVEGEEKLPSEPQYQIEYLKWPPWKPYLRQIKAITSGMTLQIEEAEVEHSAEKEVLSIQSGFLIIEPDYLIDVTAIARCIDWRQNRHAVLALVDKFQHSRHSEPIFKGVLINKILDQLLYDQNMSLDQCLKDAFVAMPLTFIELYYGQDQLLRDLITEMRRQSETIRRCLRELEEEHQAVANTAMVEPSFLSPRWGLQGRLDVLQQVPNAVSGDIEQWILELKSSNLWHDKPKAEHSAQALVYELMVQEYYPAPKPYLLYSGAKDPTKALVRVDWTRSFQQEVMLLRNEIMFQNRYLAHEPSWRKAAQTIEQNLRTAIEDRPESERGSYPWRHVQESLKQLHTLPESRKAYFWTWVLYQHRTLWQQKMGKGSMSADNDSIALAKRPSQADVWRLPPSAKEDQGYHLSGLVLAEEGIRMEDDPPQLWFSIPTVEAEDTAEHAPAMEIQFRVGDIALLYEMPREQNSTHPWPWKDTIWKVTILQMDTQSVRVQLRQKQMGDAWINPQGRFALDADFMDKPILESIHGLMGVLTSGELEKQNIALGLTPPRLLDEDQRIAFKSPSGLSLDALETSIVQSALASQDYYLISGPPGTGKTSRTMAAMVESIWAAQHTRILLVGYTHRAVDELCTMLERNQHDYTRIGSRASTDSQFHIRLLEAQLQYLQREAEAQDQPWGRDELHDALLDQRIWVGTLASILGKESLFNTGLHFTHILVDEASQISEPQMLSLWHKTRGEAALILVGDEKQLGCISEQTDEQRRPIHLVEDWPEGAPALQDLNDSYFARIKRTCLEQGWHHASHSLVSQGRMHPHVAAFINQSFYEGALQSRALSHQSLDRLFPPEALSALALPDVLAMPGTIFLPVIQDLAIEGNAANPSQISKRNDAEARAICQLAQQLYALLSDPANSPTGAGFHPDTSLGIMAPYRAQVACIRELLSQTGIPELALVRVDTVERFQGAERDFILVSLCLNSALQVTQWQEARTMHTTRQTAPLNNATDQPVASFPVDSKLNVMLSRAKMQQIVVGNPEWVQLDPVFSRLMKVSYQLEPFALSLRGAEPKTS